MVLNWLFDQWSLFITQFLITHLAPQKLIDKLCGPKYLKMKPTQ
jgi:hypothetical protein